MVCWTGSTAKLFALPTRWFLCWCLVASSFCRNFAKEQILFLGFLFAQKPRACVENAIVAQVVVFCKNSIGIKNGITVCEKSNCCVNLRRSIVFAKQHCIWRNGHHVCGKHGCCNEQGSTAFYLVFSFWRMPARVWKMRSTNVWNLQAVANCQWFSPKPKGVCGKQGFCQQKKGVTCHLLFLFFAKIPHVVRKVVSKQKYKCLMIEWCWESSVFNMEKNPRGVCGKQGFW